MVLAGVSSAAVGLLRVWTQMRRVGGALRSWVGAAREGWESLVVILSIDFFGGCALAFVVAFLKPSEPRDFVGWFASHPVAGWLVLGTIGSTVAERAFIGSFVRGLFTQMLPGAVAPKLPSESMTSWRLRTEALAQVLDALWRTVRTNLNKRAQDCGQRMEKGLRAGHIDANQFVIGVSDFFEQTGQQMPEKIHQLVTEYEATSDPDDRLERAQTLAWSLVWKGMWSPVEVMLAMIPAEMSA